MEPEVLKTLKKATAEIIHAACRDVGFFYLINHGLDCEKAKSVRKAAKEFFELSTEQKEDISITKNDFARGYQKLGQNITRYSKVS